MFILCAVIWYFIGMFITWRIMLITNPVITVSDVIVLLIAGLGGPAMLLYLLMYTKSSFLDRKVKWLSR